MGSSTPPLPDPPEPSELSALGARIADLERTVGMIAINFADHAVKEQSMSASVRVELEHLSAEVAKLVSAARGVAGTDWADIFGEEVPKARRLTGRGVRWIEGKAKPLGVIAAALAAVAALFQCTPGKGAEPPQQPATAPAPPAEGGQ